MRPVSSAIAMNSCGLNAPVQRVLPARQRLEAGDALVVEAHDRLVDDVDLPRSSAFRSSAVDVEPVRLRVPKAGS